LARREERGCLHKEGIDTALALVVSGWSGRRDFGSRWLVQAEITKGEQVNGVKELDNRLQVLALSCPNCKAAMGYAGTTDNRDFALFECKAEHCPLKAVILVTEQISNIMKPVLRP